MMLLKLMMYGRSGHWWRRAGSNILNRCVEWQEVHLDTRRLGGGIEMWLPNERYVTKPVSDADARRYKGDMDWVRVSVCLCVSSEQDLTRRPPPLGGEEPARQAGSNSQLAQKTESGPHLWGQGLCRHNLCKCLQHSNLVQAHPPIMVEGSNIRFYAHTADGIQSSRHPDQSARWWGPTTITKDIRRKYMEKLLNVANDWDGEVDCLEVMEPCWLISEDVATANKGLKIGKSGVVSNIRKASGEFGTRWMTELNNIGKEGCIPDDWKMSILVPVYKGKGDPLVCGSYRAIKLL